MKAKAARVTLIVLDGVGIGALPDAPRYGDEGSNTLLHVSRAVGGLHLPHLAKMGLGNITFIEGVPPQDRPLAAFGRMAEASAGKDTTTGHWEIAGLILERPFPVYPQGFPPELIRLFEERIGRPVLGNKPASGTAIIEELGDLHMRTGYPIVYTSADSVFQIAAHEEVIPLEELYRMCRIAREILTGEHAVGRVIARPFTGVPGSFRRTANRKDFSLPPPEPTLLDLLKENGLAVLAVGKIEDIFAGRGITEALHTKDNMDGVDAILQFMHRREPGLIMANLVDFDTLYGHRNDPHGYARALRDFDERLPEIVEALLPQEVLIITADHGCDPTTASTDHSREFVPLLVYGQKIRAGVDLGTRQTFADVAATVAELFGLRYPRGTSFAREVWG
ncbi:phosphopentomutase [Desulfovirgula thermocuniculi]|uniref:phosphopentomutase n=1 Tax=Desulfovirgula thermocuniculi TaxID=348842 RepID=UPI000420115C|nr:phosphopentomutase [Desulfovirgula thermocuniculi]